MDHLYGDEDLLIENDQVTIFKYYFPFGKPRTIKLADLRGVSSFKLTLFSGKLRLWGMGLRPYWFNRGLRANKQIAITFDTGDAVRPAVTPSSPERVLKVLTHLGVPHIQK